MVKPRNNFKKKRLGEPEHVKGEMPVFIQEAAVPNVSLELDTDLEVVKLVLEGLNIG